MTRPPLLIAQGLTPLAYLASLASMYLATQTAGTHSSLLKIPITRQSQTLEHLMEMQQLAQSIPSAGPGGLWYGYFTRLLYYRRDYSSTTVQRDELVAHSSPRWVYSGTR